MEDIEFQRWCYPHHSGSKRRCHWHPWYSPPAIPRYFFHHASSIKHQASSIKHQASSIKHQASSIKHQASSIKHQ
ncbi:hypothetical protein F0255_15925 [Vibrio coralliilyticus]|nr:hypothetical protein [Vibrio coralliilyticus]